MSTRAEKMAALELIEDALANAINVFEWNDNNEVVVGWALIISGIKDEPEDENLNGKASSIISLSRYGQHPTLTRGLVEEYLDELRNQ